ncbi:MAG: hypothetical protein HJJLKODD_02092 [Phycisphaerae bacterium]|nr:hypothetical protein [Phycisphaerae bacterium]
MSARVPWFERRWNFQFPVGIYPEVLERLRGTPARIEYLLKQWPVEILQRREREGTWSIQENIGHLLDLDRLHDGRIDDYQAGLTTLRAADVTNRATHQADHHAVSVSVLLSAFTRQRLTMVRRLEALDESLLARTAQHPRLQIPMRLVDMCVFTADHDDYHLARMVELARIAGARS